MLTRFALHMPAHPPCTPPACLQVLASKQKALGGPAPETVKAAQRELTKAQKAAAAQAEAEPEEALEARYGKGNVAAAVDRALQSGEGRRLEAQELGYTGAILSILYQSCLKP